MVVAAKAEVLGEARVAVVRVGVEKVVERAGDLESVMVAETAGAREAAREAAMVAVMVVVKESAATVAEGLVVVMAAAAMEAVAMVAVQGAAKVEVKAPQC